MNSSNLQPFTRVRVTRCWGLTPSKSDFAVVDSLRCRSWSQPVVRPPHLAAGRVGSSRTRSRATSGSRKAGSRGPDGRRTSRCGQNRWSKGKGDRMDERSKNPPGEANAAEAGRQHAEADRDKADGRPQSVLRLIELPQRSRPGAVCIILRSIQVGSNALCPDPHLVSQLVCQLGARSAPVRGWPSERPASISLGNGAGCAPRRCNAL
jgi:hypothetical protein